MNEENEKYLEQLRLVGSRFGTDCEKELLSLLGNPQDKLRFIHVAGTNGKGSFCSMMSSVLQKQGYKVGLYTSPYIVVFNDRIRVNGLPIAEDDINDLFLRVRQKADTMKTPPSSFDFITAAAFLWFYETKCDIVVLEVGLGGRYDSTNVIKNSLLSVITGIAFDHTEILGDTIEKIAWEKAGIIKENCPALYGGNDEKALAVIEKECEEKHSELTVKNPDSLKILSTTLDGTEFEFDGKEYFIRLLGLYQPANAATVLAAIDVLRKHGFEISETAVKDGLSSAVWQARFEKIADEPVVLYDGGHNPQGVRAAVESVRAYFGDKKINLLVGILADKAHGEMAEELAKIADRVICIAPPSPRALPAEALAEEFCEAGANARAANSIKEGVKIALSYKKPVLVIGSLYSYNDVSESVRNTLKG